MQPEFGQNETVPPARRRDSTGPTRSPTCGDPQCPGCKDPDWLRSYGVKVREIIDRVGWMVQGVFGEGEPPFAYTVGLTEKQMPELYIFGLPPEVAARTLNDAAQQMLDRGEPFVDDEVVEKVLTIPLVARAASSLEDVGVARRFYGHDIDLVQLVWPDPEGRYPWDDGCSTVGHKLI